MGNAVVIGGGIIGLSTAFYLHASGHTVTVLDKGDFTDNCSYGNAGWVCPSHFIPLAAPGIIWQGLKWMLKPDSPFYVQPALNAPLLNWGWNFMRSATKKHIARSVVPLRDISLLSQHLFEQWSQLPGFDFSYEHKGMLEIFQTEEVAEHAAHTAHQAKELGLDAVLLNYEELQSQEPHLKINAIGAVLYKCDAHLYPEKLMKVLLNYLTGNGVALLSHREVTGFERNGGKVQKVLTAEASYEADHVVIATGAWSREIAVLAGTRLSLMPGRGYSVTLENSPYHINHPAVIVEGRVAITPMDGNKIRFGGTMEVVSTQKPPQYKRAEAILKSVRNFFPGFDIPVPSNDKIWYGYRPCSADGLPYIGRSAANRNVIIATGHSMMGLSLGPATGKLVTEIINKVPTSVPVQAFDVGRFG